MDQEIKKDEKGYYIEHEENKISKIDIVEEANKIIINHVFVHPEYRGKSYGKDLIDKVVEYAILKKKKIYPICSYSKKILQMDEKNKNIIIDDGTPGVCKIIN